MRDLVLSVADWLKESDSGSGTDPVGKRAWRAVTALSEGWGSAVVPALVNEPRTAAEIERELDHRLTPAQRSGLLGRLRAAGIMQRLGGGSRLGGGGYAITGWGGPASGSWRFWRDSRAFTSAGEAHPSPWPTASAPCARRCP